MSKVYLKPYAPYSVSGRDFATMTDGNIRRTVFSPDNQHSVSLVQLRDGCLFFTNYSRTDFAFSVSRANKVIMVVKVRAKENSLLVNTNWKVTQTSVENREIHTNPDLIAETTCNFNFEVDGFGRVDLKVEDSGYAACVFSQKDLIFIRMNGHHSIPRLEYFIEAEIMRRLEAETSRRLQDPTWRTQVGKVFFENWVKAHEWGLK